MKLQDKYRDDFKNIVEKYILPLISTTSRLIELPTNKTRKHVTKLISYDSKSPDLLYFYPCKNNPPFGFSITHDSSKETLGIINKILDEIMHVSQYRYASERVSKRYFFKEQGERSRSVIEAIYNTAFEIGICRCLEYNDLEHVATLYELLKELERWTVSTYEGKKVPFGFIIDFNESNSEGISYIEFLRSPYSAVFSDGEFTGIKLDCDGKMIQHFCAKELEDIKTPISPYYLSKFVRLCDCKCKVGIIVLSNGDILLIQEQQIVFAKRNGRWSYYPSELIISAIFKWIDLTDAEKITAKNQADLLKNDIIDKHNGISDKLDKKEQDDIYSKALQSSVGKIKRENALQIYLSLIDASFEHSGACLAIIPNNQSISEEKTNPVEELIKSDLLLNVVGEAPDNSTDAERQSFNRRKEKRKVVNGFIEASSLDCEKRRFYYIERKLRLELLALDGAVVIDSYGNILTAGAIVKIGGGSDGGGRTAATKQLAEFGLAIKVSEDGTIEAYQKTDKAKDKQMMNEESNDEQRKLSDSQLIKRVFVIR